VFRVGDNDGGGVVPEMSAHQPGFIGAHGDDPSDPVEATFPIQRLTCPLRSNPRSCMQSMERWLTGRPARFLSSPAVCTTNPSPSSCCSNSPIIGLRLMLPTQTQSTCCADFGLVTQTP
jgi:hypothetical protein